MNLQRSMVSLQEKVNKPSLDEMMENDPFLKMSIHKGTLEYLKRKDEIELDKYNNLKSMLDSKDLENAELAVMIMDAKGMDV